MAQSGKERNRGNHTILLCGSTHSAYVAPHGFSVVVLPKSGVKIACIHAPARKAVGSGNSGTVCRAPVQTSSNLRGRARPRPHRVGGIVPRWLIYFPLPTSPRSPKVFQVSPQVAGCSARVRTKVSTFSSWTKLRRTQPEYFRREAKKSIRCGDSETARLLPQNHVG